GEPWAIAAAPLAAVLLHAALPEVRRGAPGPQNLVPLHQDLSTPPGNAHGAVVENAITPAMVRAQPIDRGEIDASLPFRGRSRRRRTGRGFGKDVHGRAPCLRRARGA